MAHEIDASMPSFFNHPGRVRIDDPTVSSSPSLAMDEMEDGEAGTQLRIYGQDQTLRLDKVTVGIAGQTAALDEYNHLRFRVPEEADEPDPVEEVDGEDLEEEQAG